jgi:hypothetical protein
VYSLIVTLVVGGLLSKLLDYFNGPGSGRLSDEKFSYKKRLSATLELLRAAFAEVDKATQDINKLMKEKEKNLDEMELTVTQLTNQEAELKDRVDTLQKVPVEAVRHFEKILDRGDKRSARRDYFLFGAGVVSSIVVTIILKFWFGI